MRNHVPAWRRESVHAVAHRRRSATLVALLLCSGPGVGLVIAASPPAGATTGPVTTTIVVTDQIPSTVTPIPVATGTAGAAVGVGLYPVAVAVTPQRPDRLHRKRGERNHHPGGPGHRHRRNQHHGRGATLRPLPSPPTARRPTSH